MRPDAQCSTAEILDVLAEFDVKATFFVISSNAEKLSLPNNAGAVYIETYFFVNCLFTCSIFRQSLVRFFVNRKIAAPTSTAKIPPKTRKTKRGSKFGK